MKPFHLTANEIGLLWTQFMQNSMTAQILNYFIETVDDEEIKETVESAFAIAQNGTEECGQLFLEAELPLPRGYTEEDVHLDAPRLFTDSFIISFIEHLGKVGLTSDGLCLGSSANNGVREFFSRRIKAQIDLYNACIDTSIKKGIYVPSPEIGIAHEVEYVEKQKYLSPFLKRSLNTIEITHLFENTKTNTIGEMLCLAFAQTSQSKKVRSYMKRGKNISFKHRKIFEEIMNQSDILSPRISNNLVTTSTTPVFSERLMMYLLSVLSAAGQGNYSAASTASLRYDLVLKYQRLSVEIGLFAKDGLEIMINNGWFEEPPQSPDRTALTQ